MNFDLNGKSKEMKMDIFNETGIDYNQIAIRKASGYYPFDEEFYYVDRLIELNFTK